MKHFLDYEFLGNTLRDYIWVAGVVFFVILLNRIISRYIALLLARLLRRVWPTFDQQKFSNLIVHPLGIFVVTTAIGIGLYRLSFPEQLNITIYRYPLQQILLSLVSMVQICVFTWLLLRLIDFIAVILELKANRTHEQGDNQLIVFFRDFLKVVVAIIGGMLILHFAFGYDIGNLLTGLSIVGAAIALALRESLENLIASFVIFFDKPFSTGDFVKVQNIAGNVERIGLRSTRVRTSDKSYVTVPNKQMVDSILDNVSLRSQIRGELNLALHSSTPPEKIAALTDALKKHLGSVREVQSYNVLFNDIRQQSYVIFVEFFTPNMPWNSFTAIKQQLNFFALETMRSNGIRVADGKEPG